jgi:hypothetical protein
MFDFTTVGRPATTTPKIGIRRVEDEARLAGIRVVHVEPVAWGGVRGGDSLSWLDDLANR